SQASNHEGQAIMRPQSLDRLIRPLQERRRDRQAEGLGGLEVDGEVVLGGLLYREIAGFRSLQDLVNVDRGTTALVRAAEAVCHEAPGLRESTPDRDPRQSIPREEVGERLRMLREHRSAGDHQTIDPLLSRGSNCCFEIPRGVYFKREKLDLQRATPRLQRP